MSRARTLFISILGLFPCFAHCQAAEKGQPWTLQQCIDYALKNNIQVRQSQLSADLSQQSLLQSRANLLPTLNGSASHSYNFGKTIDPFTNTFANDKVLSQNFSLTSTFTLFSGLQNINTIKQNNFSYLASRYDAEKTANDISLSIASAFLQILFSEEIFSVAKNSVDITQQQVDRTKKLVEAGSISKGSLLDMESQLAAEEVSKVSAENNVTLAYLNLSQLLNLESPENFRIVRPEINAPDESSLTSTAGQVYDAALGRLPEIKSAELRVKSSERSLSIARGGLYPRLTLSGSIGTGYSGASKRVVGTPALTGFYPNGNLTSLGDTVYAPTYSYQYETTPFSRQYDDNLNKNVGLHLTVPIFNGLQTRTNISRAKIQLNIQQLTLENTRLQVRKNIQQAYADAVAALKKYQANVKAGQASAESFKYNEQKFNVNMLNATDYAIAKNKLVKAQSDLLQAKYDYIFKLKVLDFYQGKPIKL